MNTDIVKRSRNKDLGKNLTKNTKNPITKFPKIIAMTG